MKSLFFATMAISFSAAISVTAADDEKTELPKPKADIPPAETAPTGEPPGPVGSREHPQVVRTSVPRLILQTGKTPVVERAEKDIASAIVVGFGNDLAIAWDTRECRWLYAWRGGFIERTETGNVDASAPGLETTVDIVGELIHLSTGPAPLSVSMGAAGSARYFGHRMVDGMPEFLYTVGMLKVSERIFPSEDGSGIVQKFSVERHPVDLILATPVSAKHTGDDEVSVTVTNGTLKGNYIYVDKKKAGDFTLSHRIGAALPRPVTTKPGPVARPVAIPLLTRNDTEKAKPETMPAPAKSDPEPENKPPPEPKSTPKPNADTPPKPKKDKEKETRPVPAVPDKSGPVITKAQRYDRDILLTDPHIETESLKPESTAFSDREFKFAELPDEVVGADHVRTFDRDKYIPGDILSYQLELDSDATVWLMFDNRVKPLPKWLGEKFSNTGKVAVLDGGQTFQVLRAQVDAGKLRLGPQDSGAGAHFYLIAASPRSADAPKRKPKPTGDDDSKSKSE